jgi:two-component sensor histidine kinase
VDDPAAKVSLQALRSRIYALGLVHQQLMASSDLQTFDIAPFLHELSGHIVDGGTEGDIELAVDACPLTVNLDFAIPLGLLVTELVTNSLKHAFPDGKGKVSVVLARDNIEGKVTLTVSDNGSAGQALNGKTLYKTGLGTRIVTGLVGQLGGSMETRMDGGMTTEIILPAPGRS